MVIKLLIKSQNIKKIATKQFRDSYKLEEIRKERYMSPEEGNKLLLIRYLIQ